MSLWTKGRQAKDDIVGQDQWWAAYLLLAW